MIGQPAGRTLGGSTAINLGMIIYPSKASFDAWEKLGNKNWNWESVSPYLRKFHTLNLPSKEVQEYLSLDYLDPSIQGTDGPIQASFGDDVNFYTPFSKAWPAAFKSLKHEITGDPLSGVSCGAFSNPGTIDPMTRQRSHAVVAYYTKEAAQRRNLRVVTEATVEKVLLEKEGGEFAATGVVIKGVDGVQHKVPAKTEVVIAAGALNTPKVLELSGIGDPELLKSHGIDVLVPNSAVGENYQDHALVPFCFDPMTSGDMMRVPEVAQALMSAYQHGGAGPLGVCPLGSSFMPITDFSEGELDQLLSKYLDDGKVYKEFPSKDVQYKILRELLHQPGEGSGQYTMAPFQINPQHGPAIKGIFGMGEPGEYMSMVAVLNHPFSRGSVHINSSDPSKLPTLDVGLLSHPLDLELQARHTLWLEKLAAAEPLASLLKKDGKRLHLPEGGELDLKTAKRLTKERIISHYHAAGTCAMMPKELGGVVDNKLRVYGVKNLRIVDASIFPILPRGNIQADVYAVAEKAADIIKSATGIVNGK